MRVLIYAPAAQMGGARAHVIGIVPELASLAPADDFLLMAQPGLLQDLPALSSNWLSPWNLRLVNTSGMSSTPYRDEAASITACRYAARRP